MLVGQRMSSARKVVKWLHYNWQVSLMSRDRWQLTRCLWVASANFPHQTSVSVPPSTQDCQTHLSVNKWQGGIDREQVTGNKWQCPDRHQDLHPDLPQQEARVQWFRFISEMWRIYSGITLSGCLVRNLATQWFNSEILVSLYREVKTETFVGHERQVLRTMSMYYPAPSFNI